MPHNVSEAMAARGRAVFDEHFSSLEAHVRTTLSVVRQRSDALRVSSPGRAVSGAGRESKSGDISHEAVAAVPRGDDGSVGDATSLPELGGIEDALEVAWRAYGWGATTQVVDGVTATEVGTLRAPLRGPSNGVGSNRAGIGEDSCTTGRVGVVIRCNDDTVVAGALAAALVAAATTDSEVYAETTDNASVVCLSRALACSPMLFVH